MKEKQTDLAAGRLGMSPPQGGPRVRPLGKKTTYGVKRLGISFVEQAKAVPPPPQPAPSQVVAHKPASSVQETEPAQEVQPPDEASASRGYELELAPFAISVTQFPRWLVYAGICGVALVIGGVCFALWRAGGGTGTPRTASASVSPSPPAAMPAPRLAEEANRLPAAVAKTTPRPTAAPSTQPQLTTELSQLITELARSAATQLRARREDSQSRASTDPLAPPAAPPGPPVAAAPTAAPIANDGNSASSRPAAAPEQIGYKVAPEGIVVSGIFHGPDGPIAVINNQFLKVGQTLDQIKVTRIDDYAVELEEAGQRFLVSLSSGSSSSGSSSGSSPTAPEKEEATEEEPPSLPKPGSKAPAAKASPAETPPAPGPTSKPVRTRGAWHPVPPTFGQ